MTNTSGDLLLDVQILHTYQHLRKEDEAASAHLREDRIELGSKVLYSAMRDGLSVVGIFDTRTGTADMDARNEEGQTLFHIDSIRVERHGLASFDLNEVTVRSLARTAEVGLAWASLPAN